MKGALLPQDNKNIMFMYLKTLQCTRSEEEIVHMYIR